MANYKEINVYKTLQLLIAVFDLRFFCPIKVSVTFLSKETLNPNDSIEMADQIQSERIPSTDHYIINIMLPWQRSTSSLVTGRNVVVARLCFHRHL